MRAILHIKGGNIILKPVITVTIPKGQVWFWTSEVQEKVKKADENFKAGNFKRYEISEFIKELKDWVNTSSP